MNPSRRVVHVRIASLRTGLAAVGVAAALAGCSGTNPATIATPFNPGEGSSAQLGGEPGNGGNDGNYQGNGGIKLRNFLVVSQGQNAPGVVVGGISNDTTQQATVQLEVGYTGTDGQPQSLASTAVPVQPGQYVQVGNPAGLSGSASPSSSQADTAPAAGPYVWFQVPKIPVASGSVVTMSARTSGLGGTSFDVPVLPPVEYYANLTPTSAAASPTPSGTLSPTGSPSVSANPSGAAKQTPTPTASTS